MRLIRLSALLVFASFAGAPALAQAPVQLWELTPVADGVYAAIGKNGAFGNCAVVVNRDDVLVVDGSMRPSWARDLVLQIQRMTDKPVRYVVNTHWHPDHTQGNQAYLQETIADLPGQIAKMEKSLADGKDAEGKPLAETARAGLEKQIADQKAYLAELQRVRIPPRTLTFEH